MKKINSTLPTDPTLKAIILELRKLIKTQNEMKAILKKQALDNLFSLGNETEDNL